MDALMTLPGVFGFDMTRKNCGEDCPITPKNKGMNLDDPGKLSALLDLPRDEADLRKPGLGTGLDIPAEMLPDIVIDEKPLEIKVPDAMPDTSKKMHFAGRLNLLA